MTKSGSSHYGMRREAPWASEVSVAVCSENSATTRTMSHLPQLGKTVKLKLSQPDGRPAYAYVTPLGPSTTGTEQRFIFEPLQAKRRLELEGGAPQDSQDGGWTAQAKKPMASQSHTEGKAPTSNPVTHKALYEKSRFDTSLGFLTRRFADLLSRSAEGVLDLNHVAQQLNAPKRRVYDVTNVLEGIQLIKKKSKNVIEWLGGQVNVELDQELKALVEEETRLDELIQSCTRQVHQMCENQNSQRFAYLTYEDVQRIPSLKEQTVIVIKAPVDTTLEVPHPEESLQVHLSSTQGPIEVFLCSDDPVPMEATDSSVTNGANGCHFNSPTNGNSSAPLVPYSSFVQVSSKDDANGTSGIISISDPLPEQTQHSSPVTVTPASPMHTSLQPPSEDHQSFVTLTPPLAFSLDGEEYLVSLAEDEGITDLFSSVDLDQLPLDMPPL
ncbi:transcription factor E2F3 [Centropristis striata]|uniref:transcription factor E2F3 n=1 Tax=Centropristis striata TaxID=184440 RepID=UPI0027E007A4|nr:transcription factor E2F3 [Centropristis striata]